MAQLEHDRDRHEGLVLPLEHGRRRPAAEDVRSRELRRPSANHQLQVRTRADFLVPTDCVRFYLLVSVLEELVDHP